MATTESTEEQPGNDGSWFLDLVAPPDDTTAGDDDGGATAAAAAVAATAVTETTLEQDALSSWTPEEPGETRRRWVPLAIGAGAAVALLIAAGIWLNGSSARQADEEAADYSRALLEMQAVLPQTQQILGNVTDPFTDPATLPSLEPLLSDLDDTADRVIVLATEPLPEPLLFVSSEPFDALVPTRTSMVVLGNDAIVISGRINDGLAYRVLIDDFIVLPDLPARAAESQITQLEAELTESLEAATRTLELLPDDPAFAEHRAIAAAALEEYRLWQPAYLEALRQQNDDLALALIADIDAVIVRVDTSLADSLARLRSEVDAELLVLNDGISQTIVLIP
jgi:hypothetical protein